MARTTRLAHDEEDAWMLLLAIVEYLPLRIDRQLTKDAGIGRFDYAVLLMLSRAVNRTLPMSDLSLVAFGSLSRLSHTVSRLTEKGLVTRERIGPRRQVSLTDEGRRVLLQAASGHVAELRRSLFDHLDPSELAHLATVLKPVVDHLKTTEGGGS